MLTLPIGTQKTYCRNFDRRLQQRGLATAVAPAPPILTHTISSPRLYSDVENVIVRVDFLWLACCSPALPRHGERRHRHRQRPDRKFKIQNHAVIGDRAQDEGERWGLEAWKHQGLKDLVEETYTLWLALSVENKSEFGGDPSHTSMPSRTTYRSFLFDTMAAYIKWAAESSTRWVISDFLSRRITF